MSSENLNDQLALFLFSICSKLGDPYSDRLCTQLMINWLLLLFSVVDASLWLVRQQGGSWMVQLP